MEKLQIQVSQTAGTISTNFEDVEKSLKEVLANYKGIVVTEDTVKESKKDVAELRKIRTAIDDEKKKIKKLWNEPYLEFEDKCKKLMALVDEPISEINSQVAEFEAKRVAEKQEHIKELYTESIGEYGDYLPLERIKNPKWDNVSYSDKDIKYDISEAVTRVRSDIDAIKALNSEIEDECLKAYQRAGNNLAAAITKNSDYISAKAKAEQRVREEAERKAELEKQKETPVVAPTQCQPSEPVDVWTDVDTETGEIIPTFTFKIQGNEYIEKVKDFLSFAEIPFIEV